MIYVQFCQSSSLTFFKYNALVILFKSKWCLLHKFLTDKNWSQTGSLEEKGRQREARRNGRPPKGWKTHSWFQSESKTNCQMKISAIIL